MVAREILLCAGAAYNRPYKPLSVTEFSDFCIKMGDSMKFSFSHLILWIVFVIAIVIVFISRLPFVISVYLTILFCFIVSGAFIIDKRKQQYAKLQEKDYKQQGWKYEFNVPKSDIFSSLMVELILLSIALSLFLFLFLVVFMVIR